MEEESLRKYLNTISEKYLNELYNKVEKKNNKHTKIDNIIDYINKQNNKEFYNLSTKDIKVLKEILNGKEVKEINDNLKDIFVFCDKYGDNKNFIQLELKQVLKDNLYEKYKKMKLENLLIIYMDANGLIPISKLIELFQYHNIVITKEELMKMIKSKEIDYIIDNDIIYENDLLITLNKDNKLIELKNEMKYRMFTDEEIRNYAEKILENKNRIMKEFRKQNEIPEEIIQLLYFNILLYGFKEEEIKNEIIKLPNNKLKILLNNLKKYSKNLPVWIYNGYTNLNGCEEEYKKEFIKTLSINEQTVLYIKYYMCINGLIEIERLIDLLSKNNIQVTRNELLKIIKQESDFETNDTYIYNPMFSNEDNLIKDIINKKNTREYKIVTNIYDDLDKMNSDEEKVKVLCSRYNLPDKASTSVYHYILYGYYDKELLQEIFKENKISISNKLLNCLHEELYKISKDTICWKYNGYSKNEIMKLSTKEAKEKIGRNDLCICGSGKKYKKCCGK